MTLQSVVLGLSALAVLALHGRAILLR